MRGVFFCCMKWALLVKYVILCFVMLSDEFDQSAT